jgi:hypothetical protein
LAEIGEKGEEMDGWMEGVRKRERERERGREKRERWTK